MDGLFNKFFFPAFALGTFIAVVLLIEGLYMFWNSYRGPEAKKLEQRLRTISASSDISLQSAVLKNRMLSEVPTFHRLLLSMPRVQHLDRFIVQSGLEWTVATLTLLSAIGGATGYFLAKYYWHFFSLASYFLDCCGRCAFAFTVRAMETQRSVGQD